MTSRALIAALAVALHGCGAAQSGGPAEGERAAPGQPARFGLHFFRDQVPHSYDYEPLWQAVRVLDPATSAFSMSDTDVVAYEVKADHDPSLCVALRLADGAAARARAALSDLHEGPVLATLDGAPLYAAREYPVPGAAALRHPVVHLDGLDHGEIKVCAVQGSAAAGLGNEDEARRVDREELRALFRARGALRELP